jgi:Protein of unknown function (DUF998)
VSRTSSRLGAIAGIAGPAAFTCAWAAASLRQAGHGVAEVQLSGLAAADATDPEIMIAGFVVLGGCCVAFGSSLHQALGGSRRAGPGPRLVQGAGALTIAAGLLRRDRMMLASPVTQSWHNQAHDVVSSVIYAALVAAPVLLAVRFRRDVHWRPLSGPLLAGSVATAALLGVFASGAFASWAGLLQRIAVTLPLAMLTAVAARMLTRPPAGGGHH